MLSPLETIEQHLVSTLLSPEGQAQYQKGAVGKAEILGFTASIKALSEGYTQHVVGARKLSSISVGRDAAAYALYYVPINAAKVLHISPLINPTKQHIRVADFGCGPGTLALALLASSSSTFDFTLIEKSPHMLSLAERLITTWTATEARGLVQSCSEIPTQNCGSYDLVCAANSLAELSDKHMLDTVRKLRALLAPNGTLVLLEPGQFLHTRRLMSVRDTLLEENPSLMPLFPCTRRDPCPMLSTSPTDWCHGTIEWQQPPLHAQLDAILGFNKHRIKYSAFIFQDGGTMHTGYRVITPARKDAQGTESLLCGPNHYGVVRIKKGARNAGNRPLEKAVWFERLLLTAGTLSDTREAVFLKPLED
jgi:SAM-dependent methyltransferase